MEKIEDLLFILDMGISPKVADWLREIGYQAEHISSINPKAYDLEIFELAEARGAIILTSDKDFGEICAIRKSPKPSVILFRFTPASASRVIDRLASILEVYPQEIREGCFISVGKLERIRRLPFT